MQPCFDRLTKQEKKKFRNYVNSSRYPRHPVIQDEPRIRYYRGLHYPELPTPTLPAGMGGCKGRKRLPNAPREWNGYGWVKTRDGKFVRFVNNQDEGVEGTEVFEGVGQAHPPDMTLEKSRHH